MLNPVLATFVDIEFYHALPPAIDAFCVLPPYRCKREPSRVAAVEVLRYRSHYHMFGAHAPLAPRLMHYHCRRRLPPLFSSRHSPYQFSCDEVRFVRLVVLRFGTPESL